MIALMITLSRAVSSMLKPTPSSMKGERRPRTLQLASIDVVDPGEALQQRALAAAVASDDPEELARGDLDADVVHRLQHVVGARAKGVQRPLLERVVLLVRELEGFAHAADGHGRRKRSSTRKAGR